MKGIFVVLVVLGLLININYVSSDVLCPGDNDAATSFGDLCGDIDGEFIDCCDEYQLECYAGYQEAGLCGCAPGYEPSNTGICVPEGYGDYEGEVHSECINYQCVITEGVGNDECSNDNDCDNGNGPIGDCDNGDSQTRNCHIWGCTYGTQTRTCTQDLFWGGWNSCSGNFQYSDCNALIFVTDEAFQGNLFNNDGDYDLNRANQLCQSASDNAGLNGEWKALLSQVQYVDLGPTISLQEKLNSLYSISQDFYNLNYELVAESTSELLNQNNNNLQHAISYNEYGQSVGVSNVWTGSLTNPNDNGMGCFAFVDNQARAWYHNQIEGYGEVGRVGLLSSSWFYNQLITCNSQARLYCAGSKIFGCTPGDTQTTNCETGIDNCPVGTKTRTCDNGVWSNFGSCFTDLDDCNGCIEEQSLCTDEVDGCCGDLICYGGLGKLCIECREEGESCFQDSDCCDRPCDGNGGTVCGCPDGFEWNSFTQQCVAQIGNCGENPPGTQRCNSLLDILINPLLCLFSQNDEPPYEQVCCPYIEYQGEQYYRRQDIEVY